MTKQSILIVEDDAILSELLQEMVSQQGYTVVGPLGSGEEAVAFMSENQVDLILMDIQLSGSMNGITAAETIHRTSDTPIIFLTGFSHDSMLDQAKTAGPYGFLVKPVSERELAATLEMALHRHMLDRRLKESQKALAKSEAQYRHLFENSPLGIFRTTLEGKVLMVNAEMARIMDCNTPEEVLRDFTDMAKQFYVDPQRRHEFVTLLQKNGEVNHFESQTKKKNGEIRWISMNARLNPADESSEQAGGQVIDGFALDISKLKQIEDTLRESEEFHRVLVKGMPDVVMRFDREGRHLFVSENVHETVNLEAARFIGKTHRELGFPDKLCRFWEESLQGVFESGQLFEGESRFKGRQGPLIHNWRLVPEFDAQGRVKTVLSLSRDITAHRQAEQNYQTLFREMLDGFALRKIICDDAGSPVDYRFQAVNPAFERMTGLKGADIVGRTVLEIMPDTEPLWIETYGRVALTGKPTHFEKYSEVLKKHFDVTVFRPASGQFACIFVDITERKRAEEERERLQAQLQQAQKMEAIGTLAGGIAHDFNNILGAILGYAEMAREDCPAGSIAASDIKQVIKAGHRARELVKQILAFSRQQETEQIPVQPALIIKEASKMLRSSLPSTIAIEQNMDKDVGLILADPTQIHQILMNLCTNAFHAMEMTGGTLSISLKNKRLSLEDLGSEPHMQPGLFVQLSVGDTGPGIEPLIREKIFNPYFTTKEVGKGTGMGLAIVHGIVQSYGGFVTCHSTPGAGTAFHVFLPVIEDMALPETEDHQLIQLGNERILYIDDEEILAEMGKNMLERLGYRVTVRTSSIEALTTFQNQPDQFDLVITDQTMPGLTGSDLARRMLQIRPGIPIILCTGYSNLISADKAKSLGIKGFALKPLTKNDIAALIRKVLDGVT